MKAAFYSFFEVLIWLIAFTFILRNILDAPFGVATILNTLAFVGGFSLGTFAGVFVEERMAIGYVTVQVISLHQGEKVGETLRSKDLPFTVIKAMGSRSPRLKIYQSVIPRRQLPRFLALMDKIDPKAFITVMDTRSVMRRKKTD